MRSSDADCLGAFADTLQQKFSVHVKGEPEDQLRSPFELRPYDILKMLDLIHPMYQQTASYGHFGRTPQKITDANGNTYTTFSWEQTDRAEALRKDAGLDKKTVVARSK